MTATQKHPKDDSKSILLLVLLLAGAGFFYFFGSRENTQTQIKNTKAPSAYSSETNALVNKHLSLTSKALELQEKKRKLENQFSTPQIGDMVLKKTEDKDMGVDHSADTNETNAYNDLNRYPHELRATDPDHVIQNQIVDQDNAANYEQAYRDEYARQFVENARRNGYEVKLNSDYVVIGVKKIRTPSNYNLGPQAR